MRSTMLKLFYLHIRSGHVFLVPIVVFFQLHHLLTQLAVKAISTDSLFSSSQSSGSNVKIVTNSNPKKALWLVKFY